MLMWQPNNASGCLYAIQLAMEAPRSPPWKM